MKYAYLLFWFFAVICVGMGCKLAYDNIVFYKNSDIVQGAVVRYEDFQNSRGYTKYAPVYSFAYEGVAQEVKAAIQEDKPDKSQIGVMNYIAVNKNNPKEIRPIFDLLKETLIFVPVILISGAAFWMFGAFVSPYLKNKQIFSFASNTIVLLMFFVPLIFGGVSTWLLHKHILFFKNAVMIDGVVVGFESQESEDDDGSTTTMYAEEVSYTYNGVTQRIVSNHFKSHVDDSVIGQKRPVGVNPNNPYEAHVYSKWNFRIYMILIWVSILLLYTFVKTFAGGKRIQQEDIDIKIGPKRRNY